MSISSNFLLDSCVTKIFCLNECYLRYHYRPIGYRIGTCGPYTLYSTEHNTDSIIMGPSFLEGGPIMCWSCPSVCLSVPCLHLEGKRKGLRIPNLVERVPGTPAPRGPISRSRGQRSRSRRLIALLAKNNATPTATTATFVGNVRLSVRGTSFCSLALERKDLESPKTARTYSTAPQRPHSLVIIDRTLRTNASEKYTFTWNIT